MKYVDDINMKFGGEGTKLYSTAGTSFKKICMQNKLNLLRMEGSYSEGGSAGSSSRAHRQKPELPLAPHLRTPHFFRGELTHLPIRISLVARCRNVGTNRDYHAVH